MSSWTPHVYRRLGEEEGRDPSFLQKLIAEGERQRSLGIPVIFTLNHLATLTGSPLRFLHSVVSRRVDPYRIFKLRKRQGGYRHITVPDAKLLRVQQWIHENVLLGQKTHRISTAYGKGCSPLKNAAIHAGSRCLVKIDLERFFESISERQVYFIFREIGYPALLAFEMTRLCTRASERARHYRSKRWRSEKRWVIPPYNSRHVGHLPQGAPTSPVLANLVCSKLDSILEDIAKRTGYVVTRYADDIVFSSASFDREVAISIIAEVDSNLRKFGFRRNAMKTKIVSSGARRLVTGLLVDRSKPTLTREYKDRVRCHLHYAKVFGIAEHCERRKFRSLLGFRNHLWGLIIHAHQIEPEFGSWCEARFKELPWGSLSEL